MHLTHDELHQAYKAYHHVNFGEQDELPRLDVRVSHGEQHSEIHVGPRSEGMVPLLVEILRRLANSRKVNLLLVVPRREGSQDFTQYGLVRRDTCFCTLC